MTKELRLFILLGMYKSGGKSLKNLRNGTSNWSLCIFLSLLISQHIVGQLEVVMLSTTVLKVEHCWIFLFLLAASTLCNYRHWSGFSDKKVKKSSSQKKGKKNGSLAMGLF
jgi:hypothetical protein